MTSSWMGHADSENRSTGFRGIKINFAAQILFDD